VNRFQQLAALSAATVAATVIAVPAAHAADRPSCPAPSKAETKRSRESKSDQPPRGATAIKGVRVNHIPKGFAYGQVGVNKHDGVTEYGYKWSDNRDDVDRKHRSLWVRVVCWPDAHKPADLKKIPLVEGTFSAAKTAEIGGRKVLTKVGDGALGHGRYAGWVERDGVVVTVMASEPLVPQLGEIIKGIRL
jgi:hypothetical protein